MSQVPEVDFILTAISDNYGSPIADVPLQRIDRDNAAIIDRTGNPHVHDAELQVSNYVGAASADVDTQAIGTEYDHRVNAVVSVNLEGAHVDEHGHIDPDGNDGEQWEVLKNNVRRAILTEREFPSVSNRPNFTYTWIDERNGQDLSSDYSDSYRWTADYAFIGYESLP